MEHKRLIEVALKMGQDSGLVTICDEPTPVQIRSHFLSLLLFAAFFLAPYLLG